jgi:hypothetical protein
MVFINTHNSFFKVLRSLVKRIRVKNAPERSYRHAKAPLAEASIPRSAPLGQGTDWKYKLFPV